jgi:hypothetical protein
MKPALRKRNIKYNIARLLLSLSEYRVNNGLTWQALAAEVTEFAKAGYISASALRLACHGERNPTERTLRKIELFLKNPPTKKKVSNAA